MNYEVVIPVMIAFAISAVLGPIVIPFLRRLKVGQTERAELESHLKKNGTPTMGGVMILASIVITSLFYIKDYPKIIPILFMTVGFCNLGTLDIWGQIICCWELPLHNIIFYQPRELRRRPCGR